MRNGFKYLLTDMRSKCKIGLFTGSTLSSKLNRKFNLKLEITRKYKIGNGFRLL